jgi:hypothetical protein
MVRRFATRLAPQLACLAALTPLAPPCSQEALRAEIERKRKAKDETFGGRKFMKVSDLDAAREAQKRAAAGGAEPDAAAGAQARGPLCRKRGPTNALGLGAPALCGRC